jgi:hypothetical protein
MSCCGGQNCGEKVSALSADQVETLKVSAQNFGFDGSWIADIISKYGPDILSVVVELARNGLTVATVVDLLTKFGPEILQLLLSILHVQTMRAAAVKSATGEVFPPADLPSGPMDSILITLVEKYLPILMQKYGPQILQAIMDAIIKAIGGGGSTPPVFQS